MKISRKLSLAMFSLLIGACGEKAPTPLPIDTQSQLQALLETERTTLKAPGLVMAVQVGDSEPWIGATGVEVSGTNQAVTADSTFRVGSITKSFIGTAVLQLVDQGKISLTDTLEQWLPGAIAGVDGTKITVEAMLRHESGIESYTSDDNWLLTVFTNPMHVWNAPKELLASAAVVRAANVKNNSLHEIGHFYYSNTNYILLAMIAAKATGRETNDYTPVLKDLLFDPLMLAGTQVPPTGDGSMGGSTNHGYVNWPNFIGSLEICQAVDPNCKNTDTDFTLQEMSNAWSAGAIRSNARDLLTFLNAQMKGKLLKAETQAARQVFKDAGRTDGLSVGLAIFKQPTYEIIGHRGEIFGFNGTIQYLPEKDLSIVVLANRTALDGMTVGAVPEHVIAALYPELPKKFTAKSLTTNSFGASSAPVQPTRSGALNEY